MPVTMRISSVSIMEAAMRVISFICTGSGNLYITVNMDYFDGTETGAAKIYSYRTSGGADVIWDITKGAM